MVACFENRVLGIKRGRNKSKKCEKHKKKTAFWRDPGLCNRYISRKMSKSGFWRLNLRNSSQTRQPFVVNSKGLTRCRLPVETPQFMLKQNHDAPTKIYRKSEVKLISPKSVGHWLYHIMYIYIYNYIYMYTYQTTIVPQKISVAHHLQFHR